jgi:prepilin-type processing-associated H-X9-DG protein
MRAVGSGCRLLASDLGGKFSTQVSTNDGGSLEFVEGANAFRHFQAMSNELCTPKILLCPEDRSRARAATNWMADFDNSKLSYFLGLDLTETNVLAFLVGDRNITNGLTAKNGTLLLATNQAVGWTKQIHRKEGNICFVDGSVRQFTSAALGQALRSSGLATNRLAIP